jgi:hypothetical protein
MRFRPNRRASMDHAPGPSIASAAPTPPIKMCIHGSCICMKAHDTSATAITAPATGVQKPINSRAAAQTTTKRTASAGRGATTSPAMPCCTDGITAIARKNKSPAPGQPSGNVENRRCTTDPVFRLSSFRERRNPKKQIQWTPLSRCGNLFSGYKGR